MSAARILIVEDDPEIAELVRDSLAIEGHEVDAIDHGADLVHRVTAMRYDLVILDRTLPDAEGAALCRDLRQAKSDVLVLMLTARDALEDKIEGLAAGADDYLTKPFAFSEMTMRVAALLRRANRGQVSTPPVLTLGVLTLDRERKTAEAEHVPLDLTTTEFDLLRYLLESKGRPVDRLELLRTVWGYDFDPNTNVVEVYISYLRRKLGAATDRIALVNKRGFGYFLEVSEIEEPG
jgi:DNA-binding response OmpR family regulator